MVSAFGDSRDPNSPGYAGALEAAANGIYIDGKKYVVFRTSETTVQARLVSLFVFFLLSSSNTYSFTLSTRGSIEEYHVECRVYFFDPLKSVTWLHLLKKKKKKTGWVVSSTTHPISHSNTSRVTLIPT